MFTTTKSNEVMHISILGLAKVNKDRKAIAKRLGVITISEPLHKLAHQLNILIPVGRAITEVAAVN